MNIMKTNMLLLDNRMRKDDAENKTVETPVPSAPETKSGMKALMFQGLQNLMADPSLAKEIGIMRDGEEQENNASNIAFKGIFNNSAVALKKGSETIGNKVKQYFPASLMMVSTLLPSALALTGCRDREEKTNISIQIDLDQNSMMELIAGMQSTLTQLLLTDKLTLEAFNKYMEQTEAWRKQVDQRMANLELILTSMAENIFNIDNNVKQGFDENNAYQLMIIGMLEQFMTRDEAIELFNKLWTEVTNNTKTVTEALAEIMKELKLTNQNLDTIIEQLKTIITDFNTYSKNMQIAAKYALIELKKGNLTLAQVKELVSSVIDNQERAYNMLVLLNNNVDKIDIDMNANLEGLAKQLGCSTEQLISVLKWLGYNDAYISGMNAAAIINAIKSAGNKIIATLGSQLNTIIANMNNGSITNEEGVAQIIALLEQIANDVSEIKGYVADLDAKFDALLNRVNKLAQYARQIRDDNKYQSGVVTYIANELNGIGKDVQDIKTTEEAILEKIENGDQLTAEEMEIIARRLGGSIQQGMAGIAALLQVDIAQNGVVINLLKNAVQQLHGLQFLSAEILDKIANLDENLSGIQEISDMLAELVEAFKTFAAKFDTYAASALNAHAQEIAFLKDIKDKANLIIEQNQTLINQGKKAEIQRKQLDNDLKALMNQVRQIQKRLGRTITPEELNVILAEHDAANQEFYANLISKTTINPQDYTDALEYLTALAEILVTGQGQTNQNLLTLIELAKKYPEYKDMIIEAINNIKVEVTCQHDCDNNNQVTEGVITIVQ